MSLERMQHLQRREVTSLMSLYGLKDTWISPCNGETERMTRLSYMV